MRTRMDQTIMSTFTERSTFLRAILRQDFKSFLRKTFDTLSPGQRFVQGWYIEALAYQLERIRNGEIKRLIVNMPPRSLKSIMTSVAFPAFVLGHDPTQRIICASYSGELAYKLSNDFRAVLAQPLVPRTFPETRIGRFKDSETEIELTRRGSRLATSTGGTLTGRGGNLIIIDDPLKPIDALSQTKRNAANEWFHNTVLSRLDDKRTGAIIIVMQRVHMDDLTGFVLSLFRRLDRAQLAGDCGGGRHIQSSDGARPTIVLRAKFSPPNASRRGARRNAHAAGLGFFLGAIPAGAGAARRRHDQARLGPALQGAPSRELHCAELGYRQQGRTGQRLVCLHDMAVCRPELLPSRSLARRVDYPGLKAKVIELAQKWKVRQVFVEEAGTAIGLLAELRTMVSGLKGIKPKERQADPDVDRIRPLRGRTGAFSERARWLAELEAELFAFPGAGMMIRSIRSARRSTAFSPPEPTSSRSGHGSRIDPVPRRFYWEPYAPYYR